MKKTIVWCDLCGKKVFTRTTRIKIVNGKIQFRARRYRYARHYPRLRYVELMLDLCKICLKLPEISELKKLDLEFINADKKGWTRLNKLNEKILRKLVKNHRLPLKQLNERMKQCHIK